MSVAKAAMETAVPAGSIISSNGKLQNPMKTWNPVQRESNNAKAMKNAVT